MKRTKLLPQTVQHMIDKGERDGTLEQADDGTGVWIHAKDCPNYCEYACGAVFAHLGADGKPTGDVES